MFILFCLTATASSVYSTSWVRLCVSNLKALTLTLKQDVLMDWSLFKNPAQHRFLRNELIYRNHYHVSGRVHALR
jgi:hypothetical protein